MARTFKMNYNNKWIGINDVLTDLSGNAAGSFIWCSEGRSWA